MARNVFKASSDQVHTRGGGGGGDCFSAPPLLQIQEESELGPLADRRHSITAQIGYLIFANTLNLIGWFAASCSLRAIRRRKN
jgi:hypothetical protein